MVNEKLVLKAMLLLRDANPPTCMALAACLMDAVMDGVRHPDTGEAATRFDGTIEIADSRVLLLAARGPEVERMQEIVGRLSQEDHSAGGYSYGMSVDPEGNGL